MSSARPILVSNGAPAALQRIDLHAGAAGGGYDERWLQDLIQQCPEVLPTSEIEPGFGRLIGVATEVYCGHGYIDNLFVTADGGIALVETKLWRNPEARRAVVAQALDYASALARMTYTEFERAALAGLFPTAAPKPTSLYGIVAQQADALDEPAFIDAVSINLRRGRMLVIAAGDGLRSETEVLAELLQSHAGARFTFALVAIELFRHGSDGILAVPKTIAKTVLIERGVVRIMDDRAVVEPPAPPVAPATGRSSAAARVTMTEELFMESMAARSPALPTAIRTFLDRAADIGVHAHWLASLNLKWGGGESGPVNLGYIRKDGSFATDAASWKVGVEKARSYQEDLAAITGGRLVQRTEAMGPFLTAADGRTSVKVEQLLPAHGDAWLEAMRTFINRLQADDADEGNSGQPA